MKALKDITILKPSDRQLRRYQEEYYVPEWTHLKFVRHRGRNSSLTIKNEQLPLLRELLLDKSCTTEFTYVQVFARGRKTPLRAKLQWLGNGAAIFLEDGFLVYEATAVIDEPVEIPEHTPKLMTILTEEKVAELLEANSSSRVPTEVIPARKAVNSEGRNVLTLEAITAPTKDPMQKPEQTTKSHVITSKVADNNTGKTDGNYTGRKTLAITKHNHREFVLDLVVHTRYPQHVASRVEKTIEILHRAITDTKSKHHGFLRGFGCISLRIRNNEKIFWQQLFDIKKVTGEQPRADGRNIVVCGSIPKYQWWKAVSDEVMSILNKLKEHVVFAEKVTTANATFNLGDPESAVQILSTATPADLPADMMMAVFQPNKDRTMDIFTSIYKGLTGGDVSTDTLVEDMEDIAQDVALTAQQPSSDELAQLAAEANMEVEKEEAASEQEANQ